MSVFGISLLNIISCWVIPSPSFTLNMLLLELRRHSLTYGTQTLPVCFFFIYLLFFYFIFEIFVVIISIIIIYGKCFNLFLKVKARRMGIIFRHRLEFSS